MPKISGLPAAVSVTTADTVPVVQGGITKVATLAMIASSPTMISSNTDAVSVTSSDTTTVLQGGVVKETTLGLIAASPTMISALPDAVSVTSSDTTTILQGGVVKEASLSLIASAPTMISGLPDAATMAVTDTFDILQGGVVKEASLSLLPAWTVSTAPTVTSSTGTITSANTSLRYFQLGKCVFFSLIVNIVNNGTGAGVITVSGLPVAGKTGINHNCTGKDVGSSGKLVTGNLNGTNIAITNYDTTYPGVAGAILSMSGVYEAQ